PRRSENGLCGRNATARPFRSGIAQRGGQLRPRQGVVLSPTRENALRSETGAARLNVVLKCDAVAQQLTALLGTVPDAPLEFAAALSLKEGHGRSLARFARLAIAELERPDTILLEPMTARSFREFATTALLLHQPHNYSERLRRLERPVTPR